MRTTSLFVIALICMGAYATEFNTEVSEMMKANTMASDAVDTVEQLLVELKNAIYEEQEEHDRRWEQQQVDGAQTIADLQAVAARNRDIAEDATAYREWVEGEIQDSHDHLEWIANRLDTIHNNLVALNITRCEANQLFIQQLKEHEDALAAIEILRVELARTEAAGEASVFAEQKGGFSNKLTEYEHLFEVNAMKEFFQDVEIPDVNLDEENFEYTDETDSGRGAVVVDNERDALDTEGFVSTVDTSDLVGTVEQKVAAMLDRLDNHLQEGVKTLEANEIQAALDTATYQIQAAKEVNRLHADAEKRQAYLDKLAVDLEVAQNQEESAWALSVQSDKDVVDAQNALAALGAFYEQEKDRRNMELSDLEWVIDIFVEQVATLGEVMRARIDDYVHDERFDNMFSREGDANVEAGVAGSGVDGF